jgi:hypothetical protein
LIEKSAANDACFPSLPTIPIPDNQHISTRKTRETKLTDISGLNHGHVIATITNTADCLFRILSNQSRDIRFLRRGTSTGCHRGKLGGEHDEFCSKAIKA